MKNTEVIQVSQTQQLDWRGFGIEMFIIIPENNIEKLPERILLPEERKVNVIVEGRAPVCYACGQKGHIKKTCSFFDKDDMESEVNNTSEGKMNKGKSR